MYTSTWSSYELKKEGNGKQDPYAKKTDLNKNATIRSIPSANNHDRQQK